VEKELFNLPGHMRSPPVFSGVHVARTQWQKEEGQIIQWQKEEGQTTQWQKERKKTNGQTTTYKMLHRKLNIEQHERH
jgi:hypothetical protein